MCFNVISEGVAVVWGMAVVCVDCGVEVCNPTWLFDLAHRARFYCHQELLLYSSSSTQLTIGVTKFSASRKAIAMGPLPARALLLYLGAWQLCGAWRLRAAIA